MQQVVQAGAVGYIMKNELVPIVFLAARTVNENSTYYSPKITHIIKDMMTGRTLSTMFNPPRELEVIRAICQNLTSKKIGEQLYRSEAAVESCRGRLVTKIRFTSVVDIVLYAVTMGVVTMEEEVV